MRYLYVFLFSILIVPCIVAKDIIFKFDNIDAKHDIRTKISLTLSKDANYKKNM